MRVLDKNGEEVTNPNLEKGYVKLDRHFVKHHEAILAVEAVAEQGHLEVETVYPNGGQDMKWVVDVPAIEAVEAKDAWDEYEDIYRYIEYTPEELEAIEAEQNKPTVEDRVTAIELKFSEMEKAYAEGVASA